MEPEVKTPETETQAGNDQYIEALAEMRKNTVSKDEYNRVQEENKKLLKSLINGESIEVTAEADQGPSIADLRKELYGDGHGNLSDIEGWRKTLQLRQKLIEDGQPDPFLPYGKKISPTREDVEAANRVASIVQECIDSADGDNAVFVAQLSRLTVDAKPGRR